MSVGQNSQKRREGQAATCMLINFALKKTTEDVPAGVPELSHAARLPSRQIVGGDANRWSLEYTLFVQLH